MEKLNPVALSLDENQFLIDHLGEPPLVALRVIPAGVNPKAVQPVLEEIFTLMQLEEHRGEKWVGVEAVKDAIRTYLAEAIKWQNDKRRGRPRFPSMHIFDTKGRPHRGGPGSDSGQVKSYFDKNGERQEFAIELAGEVAEEYVAPTQADAPKGHITLNEKLNRYECFCGYTSQFNPESRGSQNAARARLSKHLRTATDQVEVHREIHTNEFGGAS